MEFRDHGPSYDITSLVGIPYEKMNCWDLAVKFYKDYLGYDLSTIYTGPIPAEGTATKAFRENTKNLIFTNKGEFEEIKDRPKFGDLLVIKLFGIECHIGIYLGRGKFLHTSSKAGSIVDGAHKYRKLIVGCYRVKQND